ncbi:MAG: hypothetical protein A2046_12350 [Bacteroidetes bacterium GWA2_30_7]|nr:MAG: hypothetical protein A2046_12350 [Bacteroidetes bacterium GWA2_30_7]
MKNLIFIALVLFSSILNATSYVSATNGDWSDDDTWSPSGNPGNNDDITINHIINLDVSVTTKTSITINDAGSLNSLTSSLQIKNGVSLTVSGELIVFNLQFDNGSIIVIENIGIVEVKGDFANKNNSDNVLIDGNMNVAGNFDNGNGGVITGSGEICTTGSYSGVGDTFGKSPTSDIPAGSCVSITILPVELINFDATLENPNVIINWSTASEKNNQQFNILRSTNGLDFIIIATIKGAGNSSTSLSYTYTDENPPKTTLYYLLKQIDFDGKSETFNLISITNDVTKDECSMSVNPNPCIGKCTVAFEDCNEDDLKDAKFQVYDAMGNVIYASISKPIEQGKALFSLDVNNNLKPAIYIVRGNTESKMIDKKVIMQKN